MEVKTLEEFIYCYELHIPATITYTSEDDSKELEKSIFEYREVSEHLRNVNNTEYDDEYIYNGIGEFVLDEWQDDGGESTISQIIHIWPNVNNYDHSWCLTRELKPYLVLSTIYNYGEYPEHATRYYKYYKDDFKEKNKFKQEKELYCPSTTWHNITDYMIFNPSKTDIKYKYSNL
jgi:hypothetical protein